MEFVTLSLLKPPVHSLLFFTLPVFAILNTIVITRDVPAAIEPLGHHLGYDPVFYHPRTDAGHCQVFKYHWNRIEEDEEERKEINYSILLILVLIIGIGIDNIKHMDHLLNLYNIKGRMESPHSSYNSSYNSVSC